MTLLEAIQSLEAHIEACRKLKTAGHYVDTFNFAVLPVVLKAAKDMLP